ncbi:UDP-glucose 4-epimerase [bacterium BMS3Abin15]|nr:UDP-glucose 4-epimerase [bacterium BMS3Abin15]
MTKILITGGAGFIGSHIVDALINKDHDVIVVDNLVTGQKENVNSKAKFYEKDITDFTEMERIFLSEKPEVIFHLAAQIDVRKSLEDPLFDANSNIMSSLNLIELSQENNIKKFIFSSTGGAIYGETESRPTKENHPEWPLSPYGVAKLTVDKYLNYYNKVFGFNYTSLRYGNVYGPRQNPHGEAGVVAIFINKMLGGKQPVINGDGLQTRDYVYVKDIVNANMLALENLNKVGVYNIGTGKETSVNDLFTEINNHFDKKFKEKFGPGKEGEQKTSCLDYSKIKTAMNWEPKIDFGDGIKKTFIWFNNKYDRKQ